MGRFNYGIFLLVDVRLEKRKFMTSNFSFKTLDIFKPNNISNEKCLKSKNSLLSEPKPVAPKNDKLAFPSKGPWLASYFLFDYGNSTKHWKLNPKNNIEGYFPRFENEILKFVAFISPDRKDQTLREQAFCRYKEIFGKSLKPGIEIFAFGSFATDLQIFSSDLDLAIIDKSATLHEHEQKAAARRTLKSVQKTLFRFSLAKSFNFISRAKIPLIKFVDRSSNLPFDISCQFDTKIVEAVEMTKKLMTELPNLRPLVLVLKQYLSVRNLNNPASGGMGGYGLVLMLATFLKYHPTLYYSKRKGKQIINIKRPILAYCCWIFFTILDLNLITKNLLWSRSVYQATQPSL